MLVIFVLSCHFSLSALVQKQCLLINSRIKNQAKIDRGNMMAMLQVHHVQFISEGISDARSDALFDGNAVVHHHAGASSLVRRSTFSR